MPATMRLLGWKSQGLRCPDHELSFEASENVPYKVTLVQMPNGTGKTTTLNLLRAALSGSARDGLWNQQKIREYQKKGSTDRSGYFQVSLLLNSKRVTVRLEFDFLSGTVTYKTTKGGTQVIGFEPPADFRQFMNENFVTFYVFDGELAHNLLSSEHTDAEKVVEHLFQVNTLLLLEKKVREFWDSRTKNHTATEVRGLSRRRNRVGDLRAHLQKLKSDQAKLLAERTELLAYRENLDQTYQRELSRSSELKAQLALAEKRANETKARVNSLAKGLLDAMADPHALSARFAESMYLLKTSLDRVKLPESAAREFFEELVQEDECVCGRPIDDHIREVIRSRSTQYLASDDVSLLNAMKTTIAEAVGRSREQPHRELQKQLEALEEAMRDDQEARNELDQVTLEAEQSSPEAQRVMHQISDLAKRLDALTTRLDDYDSLDDSMGDDRTMGIQVIEERLRVAEKKLAEITETMEMRKKRDVLAQILQAAHAKAKAGITSEICSETNERISTLMPNNDISVERIDRSLVLRGQSGGSVGEQLSVAYAFLSTLFNRSEHQLPFVVDSPAGPIDLAIRPKIGELVPRLSGQFIAFTISSEREAFVSSLKQASNGSLQYVTLFRKGAAATELKARNVPGYRESTDGLHVESERFFSEFQMDEEVS